MNASICEKCGAPGGPITNRRNGVVIWSRVLCEECFRAFRVELQSRGKILVAKAEA